MIANKEYALYFYILEKYIFIREIVFNFKK